MRLSKNPVNLRFCPAMYRLAGRKRYKASSNKENKSNYDESKTDGNIQKPWQCLLSIAVNTHPQMELYRLITTCVIGLMTELLIAKTAG